jgi:hypothetical protein
MEEDEDEVPRMVEPQYGDILVDDEDLKIEIEDFDATDSALRLSVEQFRNC